MEKTKQIFNNERQAHWDRVAEKLETWDGWGGYYRKRISEVFKFNIPANQDVLEIGCGNGDLLNTLEPKYGFGVDISPKMIALAKKNHSTHDFVCMDAIELNLDKEFDAVVISDTINDVWDVQTLFENIHKHIDSRGRLVINFYNRLWEFPLDIAAKLNVAKPTLLQNWLTIEDVNNLLNLAGFEIVRDWVEVLMPFQIPLLTP